MSFLNSKLLDKKIRSGLYKTFFPRGKSIFSTNLPIIYDICLNKRCGGNENIYKY